MNSKVTLVARILLGLILVIFGINKFLNFMPQPELSANGGAFMGALAATGYMFKLVGLAELIPGVLLLLNKWKGFALVVLVPISINIVFFHLVLEGGNGIGPALLVAGLNAFLIYANWDKFKGLF
jgi:uncharacterized membrane protein YphA (DoxX/SURF4 family)